MAALNFKHLKKIGEDEHFLHVHDTKANTHFPILKHGLGKELLGKITQHFSEGGEVEKKDAEKWDITQEAVNAAAPPPDAPDAPQAVAAATAPDPKPAAQGLGDQVLSNPFIAKSLHLMGNPILTAASGGNPVGYLAGQAMQGVGDAHGGKPLDTPVSPAPPPQYQDTGAPPATVPPPGPPVARGTVGGGGSLNAQDKAINADVKAQTELGTIQAQNKEKQAQEDLKSQQAHQTALLDIAKQKDREYQATQANAEKLQADIASSKIDSNHWWANRSTGGKIASIIGLILGGAFQGWTGAGVNPGRAAMDKAIEADVEDQKANLGKKQTQLQKYLDQGHSIQEAKRLFIADAQNVLAGQIQMSATKYGTPPAKAAAAAIGADLTKSGFAERQKAYGTSTDIALKNAEIAKTYAEAAKERAAAGKGKLIPEQEGPKLANEMAALGHIDAVEKAFNEIGPAGGALAKVTPGALDVASNRYNDTVNARISGIAAGAAPAARENAQLMEHFQTGFPQANWSKERAKAFFNQQRQAIKSTIDSHVGVLKAGGYSPEQIADIQKQTRGAKSPGKRIVE